MASLVLGWRMPYLLSCFNVTGQSMLVPNEIALVAGCKNIAISCLTVIRLHNNKCPGGLGVLLVFLYEFTARLMYQVWQNF